MSLELKWSVCSKYVDNKARRQAYPNCAGWDKTAHIHNMVQACKKSCLTEDNFASNRSKFFLFKVDPFQKWEAEWEVGGGGGAGGGGGGANQIIYLAMLYLVCKCWEAGLEHWLYFSPKWAHMFSRT